MKTGLAVLAAAVLACSPVPAKAPSSADLGTADALDDDGPTEADQLAADVGEEATPGADASADAAVDAAQDATGCAAPGLVVTASNTTLVPPPVRVQLSAGMHCQDVSDACQWTAGPAEVCLLEPGAKLRKVGNGTCTATCTMSSGVSGAVSLTAQQQTVVYVVGGYAQKGFDVRELLRYRAGDDEWDTGFAKLPPDIQFLRRSAAGIWADKLFVIGGAPEPSYHSGCVKTGYEKAQLQSGCGTVWKLDLGSGKWSYVTEMPNNRYDMHSLQLGHELFLFGGAEFSAVPFDSTPVYRLDMQSEQLTPVPLAIEYTGIQDTMQGVPHGKKILIVDAAKAWQWDRNSLDVEPFDLKYPCSGVKFYFALSVPGVDHVPLLRSAPKPCFLAEPSPSSAYSFLALVDGMWSQVPLAPVSTELASSHQYVTADDAGYLIPFASSGLDAPTPWQAPAWRITKPTGPWEKRAPMPYARSWFGVGWGVQ